MNFVWFLALRHLRHRKTQSFITLLGVAVGIMVLTTSLSLTNGFIKGLIDATLKAVPHLQLQRMDANALPPPENSEIAAKAPVFLTKALLTRRASQGRSGQADFSTIMGLGEGGKEVYAGINLSPLEKGKIILGRDLARSMGAFPGDKVFLVSVNQKRIELEIAGSFSSGNYLLDSGYSFVTLEDARDLMDQPSGLFGYQYRLKNPELAPQVGRQLEGKSYYSIPWQSANRTLIQQMTLQKKVIGIVVFLIVCVAALGMASVLVLAVVEKTPDIAGLRVMGASARQVAGVFGLEGFLLGVGGILLGNLMGWALSSYFRSHPFRIPGDLYFLTSLPVEIKASDFAWVSLMSLGVVLVASLLPLFRALKIKPGEVLR